jgi:hypothetical protein
MDEKLRQKVFLRDGLCCRYCGKTTGPFQIDHVYPRSKGGETSLDNLVVSCYWCNQKKASKIGVWPTTSMDKESNKGLLQSVIFLYLFTSSMVWTMPSNNLIFEIFIRVGWIIYTILVMLYIYWILSHEL